jgi:hypothetical protein
MPNVTQRREPGIKLSQRQKMCKSNILSLPAVVGHIWPMDNSVTWAKIFILWTGMEEGAVWLKKNSHYINSKMIGSRDFGRIVGGVGSFIDKMLISRQIGAQRRQWSIFSPSTQQSMFRDVTKCRRQHLPQTSYPCINFGVVWTKHEEYDYTYREFGSSLHCCRANMTFMIVGIT